jgi:Ca2+-binding RTX toxin-like protein
MALHLITGRSVADTIIGTALADQILALDGNDNVRAGGGDDVIVGGNGNDALYGELGNDVVDGGLGNDYIDGGEGNDTLMDSGGIDTFVGGAGFDTIDYSGTQVGRGVDVFLTLGIGGRDAAGDKFTGIENATGSKFQDFLWGNNADNVLDGREGNDFLRGFDGNDTLIGGNGNDEFYGDAGLDIFRPGSGQDIIVGGSNWDTVDMTGETGGMIVDFGKQLFAGSLQEWGKPDGDQIDAEYLIATNLDDSINLNGQVGWNFIGLNGADGNDVLSGALLYFGGNGEDTIRLNGRAETVGLQLNAGYDKITAFDHAGGDLLRVSKAAFGLATDPNGNAIFNWVDTTDAPHALAGGPTFIYEKTTQILWFDADGTGNTSAPIALAGFYSLPNDPTTGMPVAPTASDLVFVA